jgi:hypothetical protein
VSKVNKELQFITLIKIRIPFCIAIVRILSEAAGKSTWQTVGRNILGYVYA